MSMPARTNRRLTSAEVIYTAFERSLRAANPQYRSRHEHAWLQHATGERGPVANANAVADLLKALGAYADTYRLQYPGSVLDNDSVLGRAWQEMLRGFIDLLNGELGPLDGGALDAAARDLYRWAGFEDEL